jgi:hypothetical protein
MDDIKRTIIIRKAIIWYTIVLWIYVSIITAYTFFNRNVFRDNYNEFLNLDIDWHNNDKSDLVLYMLDYTVSFIPIFLFFVLPVILLHQYSVLTSKTRAIMLMIYAVLNVPLIIYYIAIVLCAANKLIFTNNTDGVNDKFNIRLVGSDGIYGCAKQFTLTDLVLILVVAFITLLPLLISSYIYVYRKRNDAIG